jgi:hypothetical protein
MREPTFTSVIQLIHNPGEHHGRKVRVIGFCAVAFEGTAMYVSEAEYRAAATKKAIWLEVPLSRANQKLNEKLALVEGTFDAENMGHLRMYAGCIKDVDRFELCSDPAAPR